MLMLGGPGQRVTGGLGFFGPDPVQCAASWRGRVGEKGGLEQLSREGEIEIETEIENRERGGG